MRCARLIAFFFHLLNPSSRRPNTVVVVVFRPSHHLRLCPARPAAAMDALRGGLVIPKGMTGLAAGGSSGTVPSTRGTKHSERVSYFASVADMEAPTSKPEVQIPGDGTSVPRPTRPLTASLFASPWWSPEVLRRALSDAWKSRGSTSQPVGAVVVFVLVALFLVGGIVSESRARSGAGEDFTTHGMSTGGQVAGGARGTVGPAGGTAGGGARGGWAKGRVGAFEGWIQPSRKSGHEHAKSKLYNIIAPSPPPPGEPPVPPPPAPMLDFQRWCLAAQVLTGDQLLFAPVKQFLVDQGRMGEAEPIGRQVMWEWLQGKTVLGKPFKLGGKNLQALVGDMYVYLREQEVTLTRKTKCLLYRAQQVFGYVGAPWTGAMNDKEMAKAETEAMSFLKSVGFISHGEKLTRAKIKEFLYGKTVNGKVWVQASKSKKEELADLLDYKDVAEGRALGYRDYQRAAAMNPGGQLGGVIAGGGVMGGGNAFYDTGGYQLPQFPQQQTRQMQQQPSIFSQLDSSSGDAGVVGTEREVLLGFHKYLDSLGGNKPTNPEQLLHMLTRYLNDRKAHARGMSGMLADGGGASGGADQGGGTGWDAAGQALVAKLRREMDPQRASAADQTGTAVGAVVPQVNIAGGADPMVDGAVRELLAGVGNGDMGQLGQIRAQEMAAAAAAARLAATGDGHIPLGGDGLRVTSAEGVEVAGSRSMEALASSQEPHAAMGSALAALMTSPPNPPFPPENPPPPPPPIPDWPEPPLPAAPVTGEPRMPRAPKPPPSPPPPRSTEVEDMERMKRAAALLRDAKGGSDSGDRPKVRAEARGDKGSDASQSGHVNTREGDSSYASVTLVSHRKLGRAASVGLAVGFAGGLLWMLREHKASYSAVGAGAGMYVFGVIVRGPTDWLPVIMAVLAAAAAAASQADWTAISAVFERIPDTYKPFSRLGRPVADGAMSKATPPISGYTGRPVGQSPEVAAGLAVTRGRGGRGEGGSMQTFFGGGADAEVRDAVMHAEMNTWQRRRQLQPGQMGELVRGVLKDKDPEPPPGPQPVGDIFGPSPGTVTTGMGVQIVPPLPRPGDGSYIMGKGWRPPGMSGGV